MPIQQTKKQSDLEKRLKLLRQQVYGKQKLDVGVPQHLPSPISILTSNPTAIHSDADYLYQDLRKILILSSIAIGAQVTLFILSKNHLLNLNLF